MLGPAAHGPRAGPGSGASFRNRERGGRRLPAPCPVRPPAGPARSRTPHLDAPLAQSASAHFPTTGKPPSGAADFRSATLPQNGSVALGRSRRPEVTGMNPLSPYLNVDPRYLVQDTDEFILPTGANKTRGRFELAFFTIGGCCMTGAAFGAVNGLRLGLKETQNMAWSKPRNVQILNMVTRQGALWANTLGSLALLYSAFGVVIEKTRGAEDDLNTVAAGTMTGMLYKCTGGLRGVARGGLAGLTLTSLYALYNNWEHMKGSLLQQSL
ncbi:mitochondrial import inner membrane translocase subunit Tim23 isoform X1 [Ochotona curzoniae]|uniref:mitochondrial import inner membrane translocase subunit Tim23 isoform X1 n=1 Tax=Ochotona curzoniae TaxID=130825 RepID=UPI001B350A79|nr:mitochondrial import inner membrane translocase subunit Tim23 isoform X1 [Ochotona curzoniae]